MKQVLTQEEFISNMAVIYAMNDWDNPPKLFIGKDTGRIYPINFIATDISRDADNYVLYHNGISQEHVGDVSKDELDGWDLDNFKEHVKAVYDASEYAEYCRIAEGRLE